MGSRAFLDAAARIQICLLQASPLEDALLPPALRRRLLPAKPLRDLAIALCLGSLPRRGTPDGAGQRRRLVPHGPSAVFVTVRPDETLAAIVIDALEYIDAPRTRLRHLHVARTAGQVFRLIPDPPQEDFQRAPAAAAITNRPQHSLLNPRLQLQLVLGDSQPPEDSYLVLRTRENQINEFIVIPYGGKKSNPSFCLCT